MSPLPYGLLYRLLAAAGRPFGGVRPRRLTHWLARRAYGSRPPGPGEHRWYRDRYGNRFLLHPHYHMDQCVIATGVYEEALGAFIERHVRPGMVCLDVGANQGLVAVHLGRRVRPGGHVHAFEPVPHLLAALRRHIEHNGLAGTVTAHPAALADRDGTGAMFVADEVATNQGMGSIANPDAGRLPHRIAVAFATLDGGLGPTLDRLDFVKVDIQGAEPLFLAGARQTLLRLRPDLCLEFSPEDLAGGGTTSRDLALTLAGLGYRLFRLTRRGRAGPPLDPASLARDFAGDVVYGTMRR